MVQNSSWEAKNSLGIHEISAFYGSRICLPETTNQMNPWKLCILYRWIQFKSYISSFLNMYFNSSLLSFKCSPSFNFPTQNPISISVSFHACSMPNLSHPRPFYRPKVCRGLQLRNFLLSFLTSGYETTQLVEEMHYKPQGRTYDSRWGLLRFFVDLTLQTALWPWGRPRL